MIIEVMRYAGSHVGDSILEPLLSDDALAFRGRQEMDARAQPWVEHAAAVPWRDELPAPGTLVEFTHGVTGQRLRAKVTGIELVMRDGKVETNISMEQPL